MVLKNFFFLDYISRYSHLLIFYLFFLVSSTFLNQYSLILLKSYYSDGTISHILLFMNLFYRFTDSSKISRNVQVHQCNMLKQQVLSILDTCRYNPYRLLFVYDLGYNDDIGIKLLKQPALDGGLPCSGWQQSRVIRLPKFLFKFRRI